MTFGPCDGNPLWTVTAARTRVELMTRHTYNRATIIILVTPLLVQKRLKHINPFS